MGFFGKTLSVLASDPLFSTVITFCTLILLYFPNHFLLVVFSPILISTSFLLLSLLRLGAIQRSTQPPTSTTTTTAVKESNINAVVPTTKHGSMILDEYHKPVLSESNEEFSTNLDLNNSTQQLSIPHHDLIIDDHAWVCSDLSAISSKCDSVSAGPTTTTKSFYSDSFVEWDLRAPLEVIYEEYEGEEEEEEGKEKSRWLLSKDTHPCQNSIQKRTRIFLRRKIYRRSETGTRRNVSVSSGKEMIKKG